MLCTKIWYKVQFSSVSQLRPHGLQHAWPPCPSQTPRACSNSCPSSLCWHLTISSCYPLLLPPSIFLSIRVFSNESVLRIRWPTYWSFSFRTSPSNEYSRLISFRINWFDLISVQGALRSLLQHHSSKPSILWLSAFFMVQLSHPYMTTGKTIALNIQSFFSKVMYLLLNMLSRFVIVFLLMAVVTICRDFCAQENKVCHFFHCFSIYLPWSDGTGCYDLNFLNIEF